MDKKFKDELKAKLLEEKKGIEKELGKFADVDKKVPGNWKTRFAQLDDNDDSIEDASSQVEAYSNLLSVEHSLELKLKDINSALEKIDKKNFGLCEKCGKAIPEERLEINPSSRNCMKCNK